MSGQNQNHGGGVDAAAAHFGGKREEWLDLSTGINPVAYPLCVIPSDAWCALPDRAAQSGLVSAARAFWRVPDGAAVLAIPGASAAIAMVPLLAQPGRVHIPSPTYNEHAAAFAAAGWQDATSPQDAQAQVVVHPNNPDGRLFTATDLHAPLRIIDESFCDVMPHASLIDQAGVPGTLILKSFGKFWGLAGLRLGFVIGDPVLVSRLEQMLGPWPVAGPALMIGTQALHDPHWAENTRIRLTADAARLDGIAQKAGAKPLGGTTLFRLFEVSDAIEWQARLAHYHIWSRVFPYNPRWLRLGLPSPDKWDRLEAALR